VDRNLRNGVRQFGCLACVRQAVPSWHTIPLEQAIAEFKEAGMEYVSGWVNSQRPVQAQCLTCERMIRPALKHVRAGHGCPHCNLLGAWSLPRLLRHPEMAAVPSSLYLIEFTDTDDQETVFHKIGITVRDGITPDRIYRHTKLDSGRLLASADGDRITCFRAEQEIIKHVRERAYRPAPGRIRNGDTECFLPGDPIDLAEWMQRAGASQVGI
jgi:hypothetical protein